MLFGAASPNYNQIRMCFLRSSQYRIGWSAAFDHIGWLGQQTRAEGHHIFQSLERKIFIDLYSVFRHMEQDEFREMVLGQ